LQTKTAARRPPILASLPYWSSSALFSLMSRSMRAGLP